MEDKNERPSKEDILKAAKDSDWRVVNPEDTLYLDIDKGRVVIELAPEFAPKNIDNIKKLVREGYFDGLAIIRHQENYVVQWGDPNKNRPIKVAAEKVEGEFTIAYEDNTPFTPLPYFDGYAPQVGYVNGFAAARDPNNKTTWLTHCRGALGVGRGNETDSGNGSGLYVVTSDATRNLDRNITVVGRVIQGLNLLSSLPYGTGPLGFYDKAQELTPIKSIKIASDLPESERIKIEILRTDTNVFKNLIDTQKYRLNPWYIFSTNYLELCKVTIPKRPSKE